MFWFHCEPQPKDDSGRITGHEQNEQFQVLLSFSMAPVMTVTRSF